MAEEKREVVLMPKTKMVIVCNAVFCQMWNPMVGKLFHVLRRLDVR